MPLPGARLAHLRLANQRIIGSAFTSPVDAVRFMLAVQGQDLASAKWAVGLRAPGCTQAEVDAALAGGAIVRSWPLRGTLHLCAAEDLGWMLALTAPRTIAGMARRRASLGLDERSLERAREIVLGRLRGKTPVTREELVAEIDGGGVSTAGQRGYHILAHLALRGAICLGPMRGKRQTFVRLDTWVKRPRRLERDEALGELARRYFTSHGPATVRDFTAWTKLPAGDVKAALEIAAPDLAERDVEGVRHYMASDAEDRLAAATDVARSVVALPGFDEYILGYRERGAILAAEHATRIVPGGKGIFLPAVAVGGEVVGTWRRASKAKTCVIEATPFTRWSAAVAKRFERAARAYTDFISAPAASVRVSTTPSPAPSRASPARSRSRRS